MAGAFVAPIAGRVADRGLTKPATAFAILTVVACFLLVFASGGHVVAVLFVAALLLDVGISCNLVLGQRSIFALGAEIRSRLNGLYMAIFFCGGALGSAVASVVHCAGGQRPPRACGAARGTGRSTTRWSGDNRISGRAVADLLKSPVGSLSYPEVKTCHGASVAAGGSPHSLT